MWNGGMNMEFEKVYSISEIAAELQVSSNSIRNWCNEFELIIPRDEKGHRYFDDNLLQLLKIIKKGRTQGHGITTIKKALIKNNIIEIQKENALEAFSIGALDKKEVKEILGTIVSELIAEREEALIEMIKKDIQEEFKKAEEQRDTENKRLLEVIEKLREEQRRPWWKKYIR